MEMSVYRLTYGNTNTYLIMGAHGGLLVDTGYAGTLPAFYQALKKAGRQVKDIAFVMATHYHPDHCGLIGELQRHGAGLILPECQRAFVHASDPIFDRDRLRYVPADQVLPRMRAFYDDKDAVIFGCAGLKGILPGTLNTPGTGLFMFGEVCTAGGVSEFGNLMLSKLRLRRR